MSVRKMNGKANFAAWGAFLLIVILSRLVESRIVVLPTYHLIQSSLALTCLLLGIWIVVNRRFTFAAIALTTLGFIIGQWWLLEGMLMVAIWKINGFAP